MTATVTKVAPAEPRLIWCWPMKPFVPEGLDGRNENWTATPYTTAYARDNGIDLAIVPLTSIRTVPTLIMADVHAWEKAGKPKPDVPEARMPNLREIFWEFNVANMHLTDVFRNFTAEWLWGECYDIGDEVMTVCTELGLPRKVEDPTIIAYWALAPALRHKGHIMRTRTNDLRFARLRPQAIKPWGKRWGPR